MRLEGFAPSVKHRKDALIASVEPFGIAGSVDETHSRKLWRSVRDAAPFCHSGSSPDGRCGASRRRPRAAHEFAAEAAARRAVVLRLGRRADLGRAAAVRTMPARPPSAAPQPRPAATPRWSARRRRCAPSVDVFEPQTGALAGVTKRVKESFDPKGVLNPGRMWAGV